MPAPGERVRERADADRKREGVGETRAPRLQIRVAEPGEPRVRGRQLVRLLEETEGDDERRERVRDRRVAPIEYAQPLALRVEVRQVEVVVLNRLGDVMRGELRNPLRPGRSTAAPPSASPILSVSAFGFSRSGSTTRRIYPRILRLSERRDVAARESAVDRPIRVSQQRAQRRSEVELPVFGDLEQSPDLLDGVTGFSVAREFEWDSLDLHCGSIARGSVYLERPLCRPKGGSRTRSFTDDSSGAGSGWLAADLRAPEKNSKGGRFPLQGRPLSLPAVFEL